jgi:hypothetical protein
VTWMAAAIGKDERARIADYLLDVSAEMTGAKSQLIRDCWEQVRQMAFAVQEGVFSEPGPYMLLAPGDREPPPGWDLVEGTHCWIRKLPEGGS